MTSKRLMQSSVFGDTIRPWCSWKRISCMRSLFLKSALILTVVVSWSGVPAAQLTNATNGTNPSFKAIDPQAFSPDGVLYAGDTQAAAIFALDLGKTAAGGAPGAKAI